MTIDAIEVRIDPWLLQKQIGILQDYREAVQSVLDDGKIGALIEDKWFDDFSSSDCDNLDALEGVLDMLLEHLVKHREVTVVRVTG